MLRRVVVAAVFLCVSPCLAVDLRDTQWFGYGEIVITLDGHSSEKLYYGVIAFTGKSPKKGDALLEGLSCRWTSKSKSSPSFTLIPTQSAANELADDIRAELPGVTVSVKPMPMTGTASLQIGSITFALRYKLTFRSQGQRVTGYYTINQSGSQITGLTTTGQGGSLLPRIHEVLTHLLNR